MTLVLLLFEATTKARLQVNIVTLARMRPLYPAIGHADRLVCCHIDYCLRKPVSGG